MTSRWGRSGNPGWRASPPDPEQDQRASRRPVSRAEANRGVHLIGHPARRGVYLVCGTLVLVAGVVVALMTCRSNPLRPTVSVLAMSLLAVRVLRRSVSHAVRSSIDSNRALGDLQDRECDKGPEGEANAQRSPTEDPPLIPHAATLQRQPGRRASAGP